MEKFTSGDLSLYAVIFSILGIVASLIISRHVSENLKYFLSVVIIIFCSTASYYVAEVFDFKQSQKNLVYEIVGYSWIANAWIMYLYSVYRAKKGVFNQGMVSITQIMAFCGIVFLNFVKVPVVEFCFLIGTYFTIRGIYKSSGDATKWADIIVGGFVLIFSFFALLARFDVL